jgi:hypothetical protein
VLLEQAVVAEEVCLAELAELLVQAVAVLAKQKVKEMLVVVTLTLVAVAVQAAEIMEVLLALEVQA